MSLQSFLVKANLTEVAIVYNCNDYNQAISEAKYKLWKHNPALFHKLDNYEWLAEKYFDNKINIVELL